MHSRTISRIIRGKSKEGILRSKDETWGDAEPWTKFFRVDDTLPVLVRPSGDTDFNCASRLAQLSRSAPSLIR
jgi:hypothetical protein